MPRDSSGNYTLPAGNPVVTGTTVDSSWANNTMEDLRSAIQDSLSRSGNGGMLSAFKNSDGVVGAPGITFNNETTSGLYRAATNDVRMSVAGVDRVRFRNNLSQPIQSWNGTAWKDFVYPGVDTEISGNWTFSGNNTFSGSNTFAGATTVPAATVTAHEAALTILESQITNGSILARLASNETISGDWTFGGTVRLTTTTDLSLTSTGHAFQIGASNSANLAMDANEIMARSNGVAAELLLNASGGDVSVNSVSVRSADIINSGTFADARIAASNVTQHQSSLAIAASQINSGTLAVARGGTGVTTSTGSGSTVRSANPTFTGTANFATISAATVNASSNITLTSDLKHKKNIARIEGALEKLLKLNGYTFELRYAEGPRQMGVIAQEVQKVAPEVVSEDSRGLSVAYGNLIALVIEAIKDIHYGSAR